MSKTYFANLPSDEFAREVAKRIQEYNNYCARTGLFRQWQRAQDLYYGKHLGEDSSRATEVVDLGDEGELKGVSINHYRNLIKHSLSLTTSQKPAFDPKAKNSDLDSIQQARLFNNIIDSYLTEKRMGRHMGSAAERGMVYSRGSIYMRWDPTLGRAIDATVVTDDNGQPVLNENGEPEQKIVYEGDPEIIAKSPRDVIGDPSVKDKTKHRFRIVREWENKYDLAARHPQHADKILQLDDSDPLDACKYTQGKRVLNDLEERDSDLIPVYHVYVLKSEACRPGRFMKLLTEDLWVYDGPNPYTRLPIFDILPGDVFDSAEGYSDANDLLVLQQVVNVLASTTFTNLQAHGVQFVYLPEGCNLVGSQLSKGLAFLKGGPPGTEPKGVNLVATPNAVGEFQKMISNDMEKIIGVNSVVRGDPEHSLKSGAALGRVQAMAIQYASNFQKSWAELLEDCATFLLEMLQQFATTERMVALAGKHNKGVMARFTGQDLAGLQRVAVDLGNPLSHTIAGRMELADKAYEKGEINFKQYMQVAKTGNLDSVLEAGESEIELIQKENESLMDGKPVRAIVGDTHILHAREHKVVINDPYLRELAASGDPKALQILQQTTNHIMEHEALYMQQTPFFSLISGEPPPPMPPPPPPPGPGGPPMPQGPGAPPPPPPVGPPNGPPEPPPIPPLPEAPPVNGPVLPG